MRKYHAQFLKGLGVATHPCLLSERGAGDSPRLPGNLPQPIQPINYEIQAFSELVAKGKIARSAIYFYKAMKRWAPGDAPASRKRKIGVCRCDGHGVCIYAGLCA